jgi:hypothetical protein
MVVRAGGQIFSVTVFTGLEEPTAEVINGVGELSDSIAERLGS